MSPTVALLGTAVWIGFAHTLFGPDHYVPFVAMSRIGDWSLRKTVIVTLLCGIGHVASSVVLGLIGILAGVMLRQLEIIEDVRGDIAGWLLLGFGLAYLVWGVVRAIRNIPHRHWHIHTDGTRHRHAHAHQGEHLHAHEHEMANSRPAGETEPYAALTPWILFTIFLFGPCEPLIPILMYPAAHANAVAVVLVTLAFGVATLTTMTTVVLLMRAGLDAIPGRGLDRFGHAAAGLAITGCGLAVKFGL